MAGLTLYGERQWGSVIVESQLVWYGLDYTFVSVGDLFQDETARQKIEPLNPLGQIPVLKLEDGTVMTESAAITLLLADITGWDDLVPGPGAPERAAFLRWLIFLTSNIYPTYTYGDLPGRFVKDEAAQGDFLETVTDYAKRLYGILDQAAASPWFLGERFSAIDLYITSLVFWRPGREWHRTNAPRLSAIADRATGLEQLTNVWKANNRL